VQRNLRIFISIILPTFILILGLIWINTFIIKSFPKEKEFLPTWASLRSFMDYGVEPYSSQATNRTQLLYYKDLVADDRDPLILDQAFSPILVFIPLAAIHDYSIARSIYLIILKLETTVVDNDHFFNLCDPHAILDPIHNQPRSLDFCNWIGHVGIALFEIKS